MKGSVLIVFLLILLPLASAAEINLVRPSDSSSFGQGETLIAKVTGNFVDQINDENVLFYRNHVRVPMVYDVFKTSDGDYYIYAPLTGKNDGNYFLSIENVEYYKGISVVDDPFNISFSITTTPAFFSVNPGFVESSGVFTLEFQDLYYGSITLDFDLSNNFEEVDSLNLKSGEIKEVGFKLFNPDISVDFVNVSSGDTSYSIPVFISEEVITDAGKKRFSFEPRSVSVSMATDSEAKRIIYIKNTGEGDIEDVTFIISPILEPYVEITPMTINRIDENSAERVEISILSDVSEAVVEGGIGAVSGNLTTNLTLILNFIQDYIPAEGEESVTTITTCEGLSGQVCSETQECSGETVYTKGAVICCLDECKEVEENGGSSGKLIGWAIIILLIIIVIWFFRRRYRRAGPRPGLFGLGRRR